MAHHHHEEDDLYYLGQLGLVFFSALYAAFALALCLHWTSVLNTLLGKQLQPYLLWSGVVLMAFAVVRGCVLWVAVGKQTPHHDHSPGLEHDHDHDHHHDYGHDDTIVQDAAVSSKKSFDDDDDQTITEASPINQKHDETVAHHHEHNDQCQHDHNHGHVHDQGDHDHEDHDHGWAPLRYLVLALAIGLFFLLFFWGLLPFMGPQIRAKDFDNLKIIGGSTTEAWQIARIVGMQPAYAQLCLSNAILNEPVEPVDYTTLLKAADTAFGRKMWKGKMVQVWGQFRPSMNDHRFSVVRFRMQCCGADAVASDIPAVSNERIFGFQQRDWVKVTGKVHFAEFNGATITTLRVSGVQALQRAGPDPDPYIQ